METTGTRSSLLARARSALPQGLALPPAVWERRHRTVLWVIFLHAPALALFGIYMDWGLGWALGEPLAIALLGALAAWRTPGSRFRSTVAAFASVTCSAVLVQFSGGYIEAHFHFFVMVALIALYQDWLPFLMAVTYVALDHGILGQVAPQFVYNHPNAIANPWRWALIHAVLVLAQCTALLMFWRGAERERHRSDVILESAGEGILGLNRDGTVQFANPAASTLLGRRHQAMLGTPFADLIGGLPDGERWPPSGGAHETTLVHADGRAVPAMWVMRQAPQTDSGVTWVVSLHDLTERRLQERRRLEQLMEQDRFKTQLLNTASHELNTPISVLRLQMELLKGELAGSGQSPRALDVLDRNVGRLGNLVQQTLDVARIQSGKLRLDLSRVEVDGLVADTCHSFQQTAAAKGVELSWDVEPHLAAKADPTRLSQVFYNLVANAVKFTPAGGRVTVQARRRGGDVEIAVSDTGAGISESDLGLLFRPFVQGTSNPAPGGTGLGLYISRNIVESHGGRLVATSRGPNQGSTFTCVVPAAGPTGRPPAQTEATLAAGAVASPMSLVS